MAHPRRGLAAAMVLTAASLLGASCSDDDSADQQLATTTTAGPNPIGEAPVRVELIGEAIAAVEAARGAGQRFFEVNATPTLVNLFVATEPDAEGDPTRAVAYVYAAGALQDPAAPEQASGNTFTADDVDFDPTRVVSNVAGALPGTELRALSVVGTDTGAVAYLASVQSAQGGMLEITVGPDGAIVGALPR